MRMILFSAMILAAALMAGGSCVHSSAAGDSAPKRQQSEQLADEGLANPQPSKGSGAAKFRSLKNHSAELSQFILDLQKIGKVPGTAVGVVQNGEVTYAQGFGMTATDGGTKVSADTLFKLGATTKPLVSLMIAKLEDQGKLRWRHPVQRFIPWFRFGDPKAAGSLTIAHTLCSCTAIPPQDYSLLFNSENATAESRIRELRSLRPTMPMGRSFNTSPSIFALGGFAGAKAFAPNTPISEAYPKAMTSLVFKPLGMSRTLTAQKPPYSQGSARPHTLGLMREVKALPMGFEQFDRGVEPATGAWSSVNDMLRYLQLELSKGASVPGYLPAAAFRLRRMGRIAAGAKGYVGLGLYSQMADGERRYSHNGHSSGYTAKMYFVPGADGGFGVVILTNLGKADAFNTIIARKIEELISGRILGVRKLVADYDQAAKAPHPLAGELAPAAANPEQWLGRYKSERLGDMTVSLVGRTLTADFGAFKTPLTPLKGEKPLFLITDAPWERGLRLAADGGGFTLMGQEDSYRFERLP